MRRRGRFAKVFALALIAGPAAAQNAPPLAVTDPPGEPAETQPTEPRSEPIIVTTPVEMPIGSIVTVDQDRLFAGSAWGRRLQAEFERAGAELAAENDKLAQKLSDEEAELTQQRATLAPAEFRSLAEAFDARATEIRRQRAQAVQDLNARGEAEQRAYFDAIAPIIGRVMQERGAVVVLDRRTVLLSTEGIDITNDLIARIDSELGSGSDQPTNPQSTTQGATPAPDAGTGDPAGGSD